MESLHLPSLKRVVKEHLASWGPVCPLVMHTDFKTIYPHGPVENKLKEGLISRSHCTCPL